VVAYTELRAPLGSVKEKRVGDLVGGIMMPGRQGTLLAGLCMVVVVLVVLSGMSRPAVLLSQGTLQKQAKSLQETASKYSVSAKKMLEAARERKAEADNVQAIEMYLHTAQSELNAYAVNIEGMVDASRNTKLQQDMSEFPKEAAELHALLDHSLGEADMAAVKVARIRPGAIAPLPKGAVSARQAGTHEKAPAKLSARRGHGKQAKQAKMHKQVLHAAVPRVAQHAGQQAQPKSVTKLDRVEMTLKQLGLVKAFAKDAAHGRARRLAASALLDSVKKAAAHGTTHVLQQAGPLLGALPVRDGELVTGDPKYKPAQVGLTKEDPEFIKQENRLMPVYDPKNDKVLACDTQCQKEIVHSTIGLAFKVATVCVPGCAKGEYVMKTQGRPLPTWENEQQLKEQDALCDNDLVYMKCKWQELDPVCDKLTEWMPQFCLEYPNESICSQCEKVEL
jgi:hypothetical protein